MDIDPFTETKEIEAKENDLKWELLKKYSAKPATQFTQIDSFAGELFDGSTTELMNGSDVRVLIAKDTTQEQAIKALKSACQWLKKDWAGACAEQKIGIK